MGHGIGHYGLVSAAKNYLSRPDDSTWVFQERPLVRTAQDSAALMLESLYVGNLYKDLPRRRGNVGNNNRIFVAFAAEDAQYRDLLKGQARNEKTPFDFVDMSVKQPWDSQWKTNCRAKIKGCDGAIALLSRTTYNADGARWEMKCANEEGIPMIGVHIHKADKGAIPPELYGKKVIEWEWKAIAQFLDSL